MSGKRSRGGGGGGGGASGPVDEEILVEVAKAEGRVREEIARKTIQILDKGGFGERLTGFKVFTKSRKSFV